MIAKQRQLLLMLGFDGVAGTTPEELAAAMTVQGYDVNVEALRLQHSQFIEQQGLRKDLSSGSGVTAKTTDNWYWNRDTDLTDTERKLLLDNGFVNFTDLARSLGHTRH